MRIQIARTLPIIATAMLTVIGCDTDEYKRLAEMAERNQERQIEQNRQMLELQHEVAEGAKQLVAADAQARAEVIALQRDLQIERSEVGRQRDVMEVERRTLAASRRLDPLIADAVSSTGLLLACFFPLVLGWYLLHTSNVSADDHAVVEVLLEDLVSATPQLLTRSDINRGLRLRDGADDTRRPSDDRDCE